MSEKDSDSADSGEDSPGYDDGVDKKPLLNARVGDSER